MFNLTRHQKKCKLKPCDTTAHTLECLKLESLPTPNTGNKVEENWQEWKMVQLLWKMTWQFLKDMATI